MWHDCVGGAGVEEAVGGCAGTMGVADANEGIVGVGDDLHRERGEAMAKREETVGVAGRVHKSGCFGDRGREAELDQLRA